jgi:hypothetical protein
MNLEVRILKELWANFAKVRILQGLAGLRSKVKGCGLNGDRSEVRM